MTDALDHLLASRTADDPPIRVVAVCLGNICRSPMAAAVLRDRVRAAGLEGHVEVDSAGTSGWHIGAGADPRAAATLERHGYDRTHSARQLRPEDLADADLIVVADRSNLQDATELARTPDEAAKVRLLRAFDPTASDDAEIPDPYYGGDQGFEDVLGMIERASDGLVTRISAARRRR